MGKIKNLITDEATCGACGEWLLPLEIKPFCDPDADADLLCRPCSEQQAKQRRWAEAQKKHPASKGAKP